MLDDVKHVEAVAVVRALVAELSEFHAIEGIACSDSMGAAEQWLAENHPSPEAYVAAMTSLVAEVPPSLIQTEVARLGDPT